MKKLQVALDLFTAQAALDVLDEVGEYVDVIELGTPLVIAEGASFISQVKEKYPDKIVFADIKIIDGGNVVPRVVFDAGADMVSVLAVGDDSTVRGAIECAREYGKLVLVDMCSVPDIARRGMEVDKMAPDYVCVHVGYDIQETGVDPIEELRKLQGVQSAKAIAGGIQLSNFAEAVNSPADLIIVGGGLYNQKNMREIAQKMHEIIHPVSVMN